MKKETIFMMSKNLMKSKIKFKHTSFLIKVKDEESFSRKLVNHINNQNVEAEFIIADGSIRKQKKIFDKLNSKKKYYYFGNDKNVQKFFLKIYEGIKKCSKKFIFFCDQDDLINFKAIKNDENFLISNKDYSAIGGGVYEFKYVEDKIKVSNVCYGIYYFDFKSFFLRYFFNNFNSYYYLHRKKNLKKIWSLVKKNKLHDMRSATFLEDFYTIVSGRIKYHRITTVLRWAGIKKRDLKDNTHFNDQVHKNKYQWFKYFFSEQQNLIKSILKSNRIFFNNFYFFKIYYFIFIIVLRNMFRKNIMYKFFKKIIFKIKDKNPFNSQIKTFNKLKLKEIINQRDLFI